MSDFISPPSRIPRTYHLCHFKNKKDFVLEQNLLINYFLSASTSRAITSSSSVGITKTFTRE